MWKPLSPQLNQIYQKTALFTVRQYLSHTTESNISENKEWTSFQLSLCICAMQRRSAQASSATKHKVQSNPALRTPASAA